MDENQRAAVKVFVAGLFITFLLVIEYRNLLMLVTQIAWGVLAWIVSVAGTDADPWESVLSSRS